MSVFNLILLLIGIIYGGITILGSTIQLKQKKINLWANILMIIGGILIITSVIFQHMLVNYTIYLLAVGLILIHIAAINNGFKMYGKINVKHHIVRLIISILIITLYIIK